MKTSLALAALLFLCGLSAPALAQVKIGYTNVELILAYMPESRAVEKGLQTFEQKLATKLKAQEGFAQGKLAEYQDLEARGKLTPEQRAERERELQKLDEELKKAGADAEYELATKRQQLLDPVLQKLQNAIDEVAKAGGYTLVLNQTTSAGVSTILYGPPEDDLTERILTKLGIPVPKEER